MQQQFVIVGANLAGGTAAITLREEGFDGEIVLIGAEPHLPYERPPLSKEYLQGKAPFEEALLKPITFYAEHNIQTRLGVRATRVDPHQQVGRAFEAFHREHGVQMFFEESVTTFEGKRHVQRVVTSSGRRLECDFVVVGIGVEPVTDILASADVKIENGIVVDEYCQTNVEGIYAAGDVANHAHPVFGRLVRVEHWQNAIHQGRAAVRSMLGKREPYGDVHWFWSDQYDYRVEYAGFHSGWDELVVRRNRRSCVASGRRTHASHDPVQ